MKRLLKFEFNRLLYSYALLYAGLFCVLAACVTHFLVAARAMSPWVFSVAFEFYVPPMLVAILPAIFIAREQKKGIIKTSLLCGESRTKIFLSKTQIYYAATVFLILFYLFVLTLMNAEGMQMQTVEGENSLVYFLRCASTGIAFCFMLASVLLFIAIAFKSQAITLIGALILFFINMFMESSLSWDVANKVVPSLILEEIMMKTTDKFVILSFIGLIITPSVISYFASLIIFRKRNFK